MLNLSYMEVWFYNAGNSYHGHRAKQFRDPGGDSLSQGTPGPGPDLTSCYKYHLTFTSQG